MIDEKLLHILQRLASSVPLSSHFHKVIDVDALVKRYMSKSLPVLRQSVV